MFVKKKGKRNFVGYFELFFSLILRELQVFSSSVVLCDNLTSLSFFCRTLAIKALFFIETANSGSKQPKFGWRTENRCHRTRWRYRMNIKTLEIPAEVLLFPICRFHIMDIHLKVPWWVLCFYFRIVDNFFFLPLERLSNFYHWQMVIFKLFSKVSF